jgi:Ca2+-binding RTX toxin-like protein
VSHYPYALDTAANNGDDYADLFTADAEFSRPLTTGRDNLAKLALAQPHGPNYVRHYITNHVIEPTVDGAIGKEYLMVLDIGEGGQPGSIFVGGHYEDIYARTDAGWKFKRREFIPSRKADAAPEAARPR